MERILSFGEEVEDLKLTRKEINEKIKAERLKTKEQSLFDDNLEIINQDEEKIEILDDDSRIE